MGFIPRFTIYNSAGDTLLYTFLVVQSTSAPHGADSKSIVITGVRGKGAIIIDGGDNAWDISITGILSGDNYEALVVAMDAMNTAIPLNTALKLRISKTSSTYYEYNVKRIVGINYPQNLRTSTQEYTVVLKSNAW